MFWWFLVPWISFSLCYIQFWRECKILRVMNYDQLTNICYISLINIKIFFWSTWIWFHWCPVWDIVICYQILWWTQNLSWFRFSLGMGREISGFCNICIDLWQFIWSQEGIERYGFLSSFSEQSCWSQNNTFLGSCSQLGICYCCMFFIYEMPCWIVFFSVVICVLKLSWCLLVGVGWHTETAGNDFWKYDWRL